VNKDLDLARRILHTQGKALVLVKDGQVLGTGERQGIADLLTLAGQAGAGARGAALADRVVGKAAAMTAAFMGVTAVYTPLVSSPAQTALAQAGIYLEYDRRVPVVLNRQGDGPCPMERLIATLDDPQEAVAALRDFLSRIAGSR
jgi:hypothetical protein